MTLSGLLCRGCSPSCAPHRLWHEPQPVYSTRDGPRGLERYRSLNQYAYLIGYQLRAELQIIFAALIILLPIEYFLPNYVICIVNSFPVFWKELYLVMESGERWKVKRILDVFFCHGSAPPSWNFRVCAIMGIIKITINLPLTCLNLKFLFLLKI